MDPHHIPEFPSLHFSIVATCLADPPHNLSVIISGLFQKVAHMILVL